MPNRFVVLYLALIFSGVSHAAEIQKWTDADGKVHYGSSAPQGASSTKLKPATAASGGAQIEEVALYSTSWCGYCKQARAYMRANGIAFTDYDIEKDQIALRRYKQKGGVGVPFLVKGDKVIRGFAVGSYDRFFAQ